MRFVRKTGNIISSGKIKCGNESIPPEYFLDPQAAVVFSCTLCKYIPTKPRVVKGCQHIYCEECITEYKKEGHTCCHVDEHGVKCLNKLDMPIFMLSGVGQRVWSNFKYKCSHCDKEETITTFTTHKCNPDRKGRKSLSKLKRRGGHNRFSNLLTDVKRTAKAKQESPAAVALKGAELLLSEEGRPELMKEVRQILVKLEDPNYEKKKSVTKLTPKQQASMRIYCKMSVDMQMRLRQFLIKQDRQNNEKGINSKLNILWSYKLLNKEDKQNCSSNVLYSMVDNETKKGYMKPATIEQPADITEDYEEFAPGHPKPNMIGSYIKATDATAKELKELGPPHIILE